MVLTLVSFMRKHIKSALSELLLLGTGVPDAPLGSAEALCPSNFSWECASAYFFVRAKIWALRGHSLRILDIGMSLFGGPLLQTYVLPSLLETCASSH